MSKILKPFYLLSLVFLANSAIGQKDKTPFDKFAARQDSCEREFIRLLKNKKIDSCLQFLSYTVFNKYGHDSLRHDLEKVSSLFKKYPTPENRTNFGESSHGVGTFGHDTQGKFEKQSTYQFMNKDTVVYFFTLYYSDKEPVNVIRAYESENLSDPFDRVLDRVKTIATPR